MASDFKPWRLIVGEAEIDDCITKDFLQRIHTHALGGMGEAVLVCTICGALAKSAASFCSVCGSVLQGQQSTPSTDSDLPPSVQSVQSPLVQPHLPARDTTRRLADLGIVSAVLSLLIVPEIFGSLAIVLGAYTWRMEREDTRNRGFIVLILGTICMIIGMYFERF